MKVLIIGSKGFIGLSCYNYFRKKSGYEVYGADVVTEYNDANYFQIDASNADFKTVFKTRKFDVCINCSGAASVPDSIKNPFRDYILNVHNVALMLHALKEENPSCRFIQLSSAAVYGNPAILPVKENSILDPQSPYGSNKALSETICTEFHKFFGIKTCSVRIFSAYGPGLKKQFFWDCHEKAKSSLPISLYGTGNESRDFIYISDLVKCIELVALHAKFEGEAINIANGIEVTIRQASDIFFRLYGQSYIHTFTGEAMPGYPVNWKADISLLTSLGYTPEVNIEQGIANYIQWTKGLE